MAGTMNRMRCATCNKENAITKCEGCAKSFCFKDFGNHRQKLNEKLDEIETNHDLIWQSLIERTKEPKKHPLLQQIDQWETESINKIKQVAEENRESLFRFTTTHNKRLETELNKLTNQLKQGREENDFIEAHLDHWNKELTQIQEELNKPSNIKINYDSAPFITKICTEMSGFCSTIEPICILNIKIDAKWMQSGTIVATGNIPSVPIDKPFGSGDNSWGIYVDDDQTVYFADFLNHRIMEWKTGATSGRVVAGENGQLKYPTNVIVDKKNDSLIISDYGNQRVVRWPLRNGTNGETIISNVSCSDLVLDEDGYIYTCDFCKHEVRRWHIGETNGTLVAGGNGQGNRLDQFNLPYHIYIDSNRSVYVSDYGNGRVVKWMKDAKEGTVVANALSPGGIAMDQLGSLYIADYRHNRVMRWLKDATQGSIVVGAGLPWDLSFDRQNNLYVTEYSHYRVQKFNIEQNSH